MHSSRESLEQLSTLVEQLAQTVAAGESRHRRMVTISRWVGIIFLCFVVVVFSIGADMIGRAGAAEDALDDMQPVVEALHQISQSMDRLGQGMSQIFQGSDLKEIVSNTSVLMSRLKQDSDALRLLMFCNAQDLPVSDCVEKIKSGELDLPPDLQGIEVVDLGPAPQTELAIANLQQLQQIGETLSAQLGGLNTALASVPTMSANVNIMRAEMSQMKMDMHAMTANMGVMAGSMGSTMGRMGSWMPW